MNEADVCFWIFLIVCLIQCSIIVRIAYVSTFQVVHFIKVIVLPKQKSPYGINWIFVDNVNTTLYTETTSPIFFKFISFIFTVFSSFSIKLIFMFVEENYVN